MAVYDQSYLPWSGAYTSRLSRIWAMTWPGLVQPFRSVWILIVIILAFMIVGGWLILLMAIASQAAQNPAAENISKLFFAVGNNIYRVEFFNNYLFSMILMTLSATVGASLISRDLKHNALVMYFSRAITRGDYVAAKFLTLALFLLFVTWVPALLLFAGQLGMGLEKLTLAQRLADLGSITLHSLVIVVPMSAVVLACSSVTRRAYVAGLLWATLFFSSTIFSEVLYQTVRQEWCRMISWTNLTSHLGNFCWQVRLTAGMKPPKPVLQVGWEEPLLILGAVTILSLVIVRRRMRSVEAGE